MFEHLKNRRHLLQTIEKANKCIETDEYGRCIIRINIRDESVFLSPFCTQGEPTISGETSRFFSHSLMHTKPDSNVHFIINANLVDENKSNIYKKAIYNYYRQELYETRRKLRKNAVSATLMTIAAALVFTVDILLGTFAAKSVFTNMLNVIAWVFMWEAADLFFFVRSALRSELLWQLRMITAGITFTDEACSL